MALLTPPVADRKRSARRRALDLALLLESVADRVQACVDFLNEERNVVNAWPASTMGDGGSRSTSSASRPESAICAVDSIEDNLRQVDFDLAGIESYVHSILRIAHRTLTQRLPNLDAKPRCWAGNFDGYHLAHCDGGWSFPDCSGIPRRGDSGPCDRCLQAHIRYRARVGLPRLRDVHPAR